LKLQHLQNRVLLTIGNLDKCTLVHKLQVAFRICYVYYITKLRRIQAEIIQNHVNPNVHGIGQGKAMHKNCKRLKLGGGQA
jgi:hypothetical protein